jgi:hypothetical protein
MKLTIFTLLICLLDPSFGRAQGQTYLPKFLITPGKIISTSSAEVKPLSNSSASVFVFRSAIQSCALDLDAVRRQINDAFAKDSRVFEALKNISADPESEIAKLHLTFLIDDFGDQRTEYTSFYLRQPTGFSGPVIILDCALASRFYWLPSIAHELTHALLAKYKPEPWFDEGLAQMVEIAAGGFEPMRAEEILRSSEDPPPLFQQDWPLVGHDSYAMMYLFTTYLSANFGGWQTLRAFAGLTDTENCHERDWKAAATCRARASLTNRNLSNLAEKMTPDGILRFFAVAMTLNIPSFPMYAIPGWQGFLSAPKSSVSQSLLPSQFERVQSIDKASPATLEDYLIESDGINFKIRSPREEVTPSMPNRFFLIINPS